jgi:NAD(P)-dependent dehydrogenase (short-subunit alcohol dehydrogenase family)
VSRIAITGGSGGIGAALVARLAADGHAVLFTFCRNEAAARALAARTGADCCHYDQSQAASVSALAARLRGGGFDALVNNAAAAARRQLLLKTDAEDFLAYQLAALRGVFALSQAFVEDVKRRAASGAIVNVLSSVTLGLPPAKQAAYVTSKYALLGLTRSLAVEGVHYNVRVNAVSPGMTRTDFNADLPARFVDEVAAALPMQRLATPDEVASAVRFLLSPEASYISGANIPVAGGHAC